MFHLAFHLPYYAFRSSKSPRVDHRQCTDGEVLRHSLDVSFLRPRESETSGLFLYEAQISCVVAGTDDWRWVAYCFVDTYFDSEKIARRSIRHQEGALPIGVRLDPLRNGKLIEDEHYQDPREYFLAVLTVRLEQILGEWNLIVEKLQQAVRKYDQVCACTFQTLLSSPAFLDVLRGAALRISSVR